MKTLPTIRRASLKPAVIAGLLSALLCHGAQAAEETALQRCRAIPEAAARLACYDAMPSSVMPAVPPEAAAALSAAAPVAAPAPARAAVPSFGQQRSDEPQTITSQILGVFEGWGPRSRITLANGQVWQVEDGSEGVYFLQSPKVTVRRALMGGFQMEIEGARRVPRVRRADRRAARPTGVGRGGGASGLDSTPPLVMKQEPPCPPLSPKARCSMR